MEGSTIKNLYVGDILLKTNCGAHRLLESDVLLVKIEGNGFVKLDDYRKQEYHIISEKPFYKGCKYVDQKSLKKVDEKAVNILLKKKVITE